MAETLSLMNYSLADYESCCVVDQYCERPANYDLTEMDPEEIKELCQSLPECFRCGGGVCLNCSSRRKYMHYGRKRICNNCQEEEDGTPYYVIIRMAMKSGYSHAAAVRHASSYKTPKQAREEEQKKQREHKEWLKKLAELEKNGPWSPPCASCGGTGKSRRGKRKLP